MSFWQEFLSSSNEKVNSATVLALFISLVLAAPVVGLGMAGFYYHVFMLKKGLDGPSVNLLLGLLGAATGGLGATLFSRTTLGGTMPGPDWKPPSITKEKGDQK